MPRQFVAVSILRLASGWNARQNLINHETPEYLPCTLSGTSCSFHSGAISTLFPFAFLPANCCPPQISRIYSYWGGPGCGHCMLCMLLRSACIGTAELDSCHKKRKQRGKLPVLHAPLALTRTCQVQYTRRQVGTASCCSA